MNLGFIVYSLLIVAVVLFILGIMLIPRRYALWATAAVCAVVAVVLQVFVVTPGG